MVKARVLSADPETHEWREDVVEVPDVFTIHSQLPVRAIALHNPLSDIILNFGHARWKLVELEDSGIVSFDPA